jgi:hypothetical protein
MNGQAQNFRPRVPYCAHANGYIRLHQSARQIDDSAGPLPRTHFELGLI